MTVSDVYSCETTDRRAARRLAAGRWADQDLDPNSLKAARPERRAPNSAEGVSVISPILFSSNMATCNDLLALNSALPSGAYVLRPAGPDRDAVPVYCDMTQSPPGQSLFDVPSGTIAFVGSKLCTMTWNNDDMDSTMMWVTLEGKIKRDNGYDTTGRTYFTFSRDLMTATGMQSQWADYPGRRRSVPAVGTLNGCAKRILFPAPAIPGTVVWLQNDALKFKAAPTIPSRGRRPEYLKLAIAICQPVAIMCTSS